jgi:hypothetical protein
MTGPAGAGVCCGAVLATAVGWASASLTVVFVTSRHGSNQ